MHRIQEAQTTTYHVLWELTQSLPVTPVRVRVRVRVSGIVQGVGYRPFAHALAAELGVAGFVGNDPAGVVAEAEGSPAAVEAFVAGLRDRAPALAVVEDVCCAPVAPTGGAGFVIAPSAPAGPGAAPVSPVSADAATCAACLAELWDPADRRYRYPFVNCTDCGPRFTVVTGIPYDRPLTTMAGFADVRGLRPGVRGPPGPAVPRPAGVLPGLRPPARAGAGHDR